METTRQGRQMNGRVNVAGRNYARNTYVYGNVAEDVERELNEAPRKKISVETRKNREKSIHMNLPYVIFLAVALSASGFILFNYLQLQAEITESISRTSRLESQYINLKADNDDEYTRIMNNVDLEEIKRVAIEELGMHYAVEGQVITYEDQMSDYVKQYSDIDD